MPVFQSKDLGVQSGLPLGAIGAGKIEILPDGTWNAFTFLNNWTQPVTGSAEDPGILGYHLGLFVEPRSTRTNRSRTKKAFLLQTAPIRELPCVESIRYEGFFPQVRLSYFHPELQAEVSLTARSVWAPGDLSASRRPLIDFSLEIVNSRKTPIRASFLWMGRNLCGEWNVGRRNRVISGKKGLAVEFSNPDPSAKDPRRGTMHFHFEGKDWKLSFIEAWNAVTKCFHFNSQNLSLLAWDHFEKRGRLPNIRCDYEAQGENRELCSAVAAERNLGPGQKAVWNFTMAWDFPGQKETPNYHRQFHTALKRKVFLPDGRQKRADTIRRLHRAVYAMPFPDWFKDALLTNLAPFFASSRYLADGKFAFYEAPVICPLLGTLDVGFYGSIPLAYFFPELELSQIGQFARAQRRDGSIPHDLGKNRLDRPSDGTTFYQWKDLSPKFVLMVYRDYLWAGRPRAFLRQMYPSVKKAVYWAASTDLNGDGLPDHEGADHTFDLWDFLGPHPYSGNLFLASLLATRAMARLMRDQETERRTYAIYLKGRKTMEEGLWNGRFFGETSALCQLNGQWYADLLGLGSLVDDRLIRRALQTTFALNRKPSEHGMVNSVLSNGRLDESNDHARNVWAGMNYAFISLALMRGFSLSNLLKESYKIWNNMTYRQKSPWNQPDTVDSKTGRFVFGDYYYRNMAIWAIPIAYAKRDARTANILGQIKKIKE